MTITQTAQFLAESDNFLILTHERPDGDTLGSAAGLCAALRTLGKHAHVLPNPGVPPRLKPLTDGLELSGELSGTPTLIAVDVADKSLFHKEAERYIQTAGIELAIDHHPNGGKYARQALVDTGSAATGELVFLLLRQMGVTITREIAGPLYVAIVTDTGCLRFDSVTSRTLRVTADLKDTGLETASINADLFERKSQSRLMLEAALYRNAELLSGGTVALMRLTQAIRKETAATPDDLDSLASIVRTIDKVEFGALLTEEPSSTKISVRTGQSMDAGRICALLGGGGHPRAAGCLLKLSMPEAREALLDALNKAYPGSITRTGFEEL